MEHSMAFRCRQASDKSTRRHEHAITLCTVAQAAGHTRASSWAVRADCSSASQAAWDLGRSSAGPPQLDPGVG